VYRSENIPISRQASWEHFEKLLQEISSRFISLPVALIDSVIEETQREICQTLGFDLSTLWQNLEKDQHVMALSHYYTPPDGPQPVEEIDPSVSFPWTYNKMLAGQTLAYSSNRLPKEAAIDQQTRAFYGVKSSVTLPLMAGGGPLFGILSFDTIREYCQWNVEEVNRLKLVAEVFANALVRKRSEERLTESNQRLELSAESAGIGLWELDFDNGRIWATEKALSLFGWDDNKNISMARFESSVHPEDLEYIRGVIAYSVEQKAKLSAEYRIYTDDGSMKWIHSTGHPYFRPGGQADRLLGVSIDITERKMRESQRLMEKERLASAIDIAALGFYETADATRVDFLDERMRDLLGITSGDDEIARNFWLEHIHEQDLASVQSAIQKVLKEGVDRFELHYRYLHPLLGLTWLRHLSRVLQRDDDGCASRIIGVMQDITEQKQAEAKLRQSEAALRDNQRDLQKLAGRLIALKEQELRRLSRELHDDLTQRIALLAINTGKLELEMGNQEKDPSAHLKQVVTLKNQLIEMSEDVHRISRQLHPNILDDLGLLRAIESLCNTFLIRHEFVVNFTWKNVPEFIANDVSLCLYRIIQEGLNNILHHAGVKLCDVSLHIAGDIIFLTITDEGRGFDLREVRGKPGLGLSSMRERAQFTNGNFSIESSLNQGTTIQVKIPFKEANNEAY
jgi:PAS domain S-box-containing protein